MITERRKSLDGLLCRHQHLFQGKVIDIGGKKENKRGTFKPPLSQVKSWKYVNMDESTNPDFYCSAEEIPVDDASFDTALMCEVLEHLKEPQKVLREAFRILKDDGILIISIPFLFPLHADPYDFQRWTDTKIKLVLESIGFSDIQINTMGGVGAVIHDILLISFKKIQNRYFRRLGLWGLCLTKPILNFFENKLKSTEKRITTGYFVTAIK